MSANDVPVIKMARGFVGVSEVDRLAMLLMEAWGKADPKSSVAQHPASYVATFVDIARAAQDAGYREPRAVIDSASAQDKALDEMRLDILTALRVDHAHTTSEEGQKCKTCTRRASMVLESVVRHVGGLDPKDLAVLFAALEGEE